MILSENEIFLDRPAMSFEVLLNACQGDFQYFLKMGLIAETPVKNYIGNLKYLTINLFILSIIV